MFWIVLVRAADVSAAVLRLHPTATIARISRFFASSSTGGLPRLATLYPSLLPRYSNETTARPAEPR